MSAYVGLMFQASIPWRHPKCRFPEAVHDTCLWSDPCSPATRASKWDSARRQHNGKRHFLSCSNNSNAFSSLPVSSSRFLMLLYTVNEYKAASTVWVQYQHVMFSLLEKKGEAPAGNKEFDAHRSQSESSSREPAMLRSVPACAVNLLMGHFFTQFTLFRISFPPYLHLRLRVWCVWVYSIYLHIRAYPCYLPVLL